MKRLFPYRDNTHTGNLFRRAPMRQGAGEGYGNGTVHYRVINAAVTGKTFLISATRS